MARAKRIAARGVRSPLVLGAMRKVAREGYVPAYLGEFAYEDSPLPIEEEQTISQPYIVAFMTELLDLAPGDRVLEVGTGSGYQAAVASMLADSVFSVEIVPELAAGAEARLAGLGVRDVRVRNGDGYFGWEEHAPYDAIFVTAAAGHVPPPLVQQLVPGGRVPGPEAVEVVTPRR